MEYFSNVPNQYAIDRLAQLFENFKGERTITVYEPPKEYWNDNDVVTLIQENKNEEEKKKEESQNNVIKEVQENSAEITEKSKSSLGKMNLFGKINSNEDELFSDDTLFAVDKNDVVKQVFNAGEQDNALAKRYEKTSKKSAGDSNLAKNSKLIKFTFVRNLINLIGHNIMFDRRVFYMFGNSFYFDDDTLQMGFDLNPKTVRGSVALKGLTHRLLGHETPELSDILGKGNEDKYRYLYDILVAMVYGCADADYTLTIFHILRKLMSKRMYKEYKRQVVQMLNILAISEYIRHGKRNVFIVFLMSALLFVLCVSASTLLAEYRLYRPFAQLNHKEGLYLSASGYHGANPNAIAEGMEKIDYVLAIGTQN